MLRDIRNLFEHKEKENYYKPVRVNKRLEWQLYWIWK